MHLGKKYVCIHASQSRATYVGSTKSLQVPCKFPASSLHPRIRFICNTTALQKNLQHGCTWYIYHEFLHGRLQRICNAEKSATRMQRRCSELAGNLQGTCMELADSFRYNVHTHGRNVEKNIISVRSSHGTVLVNSSTHIFFPSLSRAHHRQQQHHMTQKKLTATT